MSELISSVTSIVPNWATHLLPAIVLVCIVLYNYDNIRVLWSDFRRLTDKILGGARKSTIAAGLEGRLNNSLRRVTNENSFINPYDIKIKWSDETTRDTFLKDNTVFVMLSSKEPYEQQFVRTVMEYVRIGLAPMAKRRLARNILDSVDLKVAQSIMQEGFKSAMAYFDEQYFVPHFNNTPSKRTLFDSVKGIEHAGMLYPLLINEYERVAQNAIMQPPDSELIAESVEFFNFVCSLSNREPGELTKLTFVKYYFRIGIVFATKDVISSTAKLDAYIKRIEDYANTGIERVYIYALGRKINDAKQIASAARDTNARVIDVVYHNYKREHHDSLSMIDGICIEIAISK